MVCHTLIQMTHNSNGRSSLNKRRDGNRPTDSDPLERTMGIDLKDTVCIQDNYNYLTMNQPTTTAPPPSRVRSTRPPPSIPKRVSWTPYKTKIQQIYDTYYTYVRFRRLGAIRDKALQVRRERMFLKISHFGSSYAMENNL